MRAAAVKQRTASDPRARLLGVDELLELLEQRAAKAAAEGEVQGVGRASRGERLVVGLTGYPNVGKSSTINALFGSKKTAVAPTPGKTKHFQVGARAGKWARVLRSGMVCWQALEQSLALACLW